MKPTAVDHTPDLSGSPHAPKSVKSAKSSSSPAPNFWRRVSPLERKLLRLMFAKLGNPSLTVVLWNGETFSASHPPAAATLTIRDRATFWKLLVDPCFQFGEAYSDGRIEVAGSLPELLIDLSRACDQADTARRFWTRFSDGIPRWRRNHRRRAAANVQHHYDIGNEFYSLWLDEQLLYTCAYYERPDETLEQAQRAKMDHICRKLTLRPGETVVEAGCGWGAFACHMAHHYGVKVQAYNLSAEQIAYARENARRQGLTDQVEFVHDDWRNITGCFDAFVSVGMLEHVGLSNYRELGGVIERSLAPHGRGLLHTIGRAQPQPLDAWIERRIFPGAYPPAMSEIMRVLEPYRLATLDVENLRLHYAKTLNAWLARFEHVAGTVREMFDARFVRMWRLYLAGSLAAFETGSLQLFQVLFSRHANNQVPATRIHQYDAAIPIS